MIHSELVLPFAPIHYVFFPAFYFCVRLDQKKSFQKLWKILISTKKFPLTCSKFYNFPPSFPYFSDLKGHFGQSI